MTSNEYVLTWQDRFTGSGAFGQKLLHDGADMSNIETDALVASGDCFVTLATMLDQLSETLGEEQGAQPELEKIVRVLMYLQRHYSIVKKHPNYRQ